MLLLSSYLAIYSIELIHPSIHHLNLPFPFRVTGRTLTLFGLWEETRVPRKKPRMHRKNMQSLTREVPSQVRDQYDLIYNNALLNPTYRIYHF